MILSLPPFLECDGSDLGAVGVDEGDEIYGFEPDGGGVVVGMNADDPLTFFEIFINEELGDTIFIVKEPERRDGAGGDVQNLFKVIRGSEAEMAGAVSLFEVFEIDALVAFDRDEVVVGFFVVADKDIFCDAIWVRVFGVEELIHIEDGLVLGDFVPDFFGFE